MGITTNNEVILNQTLHNFFFNGVNVSVMNVSCLFGI